jgi:hypothetical protein
MEDKTTIYNEQIKPLIEQIGAIAFSQGIPLFTAVQTSDEGYEGSLYIPLNTHKEFKENAKHWMDGVDLSSGKEL